MRGSAPRDDVDARRRRKGAVLVACAIVVAFAGCGSEDGKGRGPTPTSVTASVTAKVGYPATSADAFFSALERLSIAVDRGDVFATPGGAVITEAVVSGEASLEPGVVGAATSEVEGVPPPQQLRIPVTSVDRGPTSIVIDLGSVVPEGDSFESFVELAPPTGTALAVVMVEEASDTVSLLAGYLLVIRADDGTAHVRSGWLSLLPDGETPGAGDDYATLVTRMRAATAPS